MSGNHEYYRGIVERDELDALAAAAATANVHFLTPTLDCSATVIAGIRFVGATLWTSFLGHSSRSSRKPTASAGDASTWTRRSAA